MHCSSCCTALLFALYWLSPIEKWKRDEGRGKSDILQLHYYYYVQCNNRREINNFLLTKIQQYIEESDDSDFSSDDDDIVLFAVHELHEMSRLALGPRINLQDISDMECDQLFRFGFIMLLTIMVPHRFHKIRFSKNDIQRLYMALGIPEKYK